MNAVLAGAGARRALVAGTQGTVLASMTKAWYLDLPGGIVAVVGPDVHPGPVHLQIDGPLTPAAQGTDVSVAGTRLLVGEAVPVDLGAAAHWHGALPPPGALSDVPAEALDPLRQAAGGSTLPALGARAAAGLAQLESGALEAAAACLAGLGPGLTPAGDDALAGAVLGMRAMAGTAAEARLEHLVTTLPTGAVSLAFLVWAARGQSLAPVHDLLAALVAGVQSGAAAACRELASVGASSGADFALGLWLTLRCTAGRSSSIALR